MEAALALATAIGPKRASIQLGIPLSTIMAARRRCDNPANLWQQRPYKTYSQEEKASALARFKGGVSALRVAHELGVNESTLRAWRAEESGSAGKGKPRKTYSADQKLEALQKAKLDGPAEAGRKLGIPSNRIRDWARKQGVVFERTSRNRVGADTDLRWLSAFNGMEQWRQYAAEWIATQDDAIGTKLQALRKFFFEFVIGFSLPTDPSSLLLRTSDLPAFYSTLPDTKFNRTLNNYVHEFLEFVLQEHFTDEDGAGGQFVSGAYCNPVPAMGFRGMSGRGESVFDTLPHAYVEELQNIIAEGPTFGDWRWAQGGAITEKRSDGEAHAVDWFEVEESALDKSDPDCVWRTRLRRETKGPVFEMWSPVRWVAQLAKYIIPHRTTQVRLLDSGEADTWRYEGNGFGKANWVRNPHPLAVANVRKPRQQGVFRKPSTVVPWNASDTLNVLLFANTNKTADLRKSGPEKGYAVAWPTDQPVQRNIYYWLARLRNWQEKYNPIRRLTAWRELDARHIKPKSLTQLAQYPDAAFLFRLPELGPLENYFPIADGVLNTTHFHCMKELERRLAEGGRLNPAQLPVQLVNEEKRRALFPEHSLRTSFASTLVHDGDMELEILQRVLGHASRWMAAYYAKLEAERVKARIESAFEKQKGKGDEGIARFLKRTEFARLEEQLVANSSAALSQTVARAPADRNPIGWMLLHLGLCLVGGNASPLETPQRIGGCFNGGPNIGSEARPQHGPVPGGTRNCVRCRWLVTSAAFLGALLAHLNNALYHLHTAQVEWASRHKESERLRSERVQSQARGETFVRVAELDQAHRLEENAEQRLVERASNVSATHRLIRRCLELEEKREGDAKSDGLVAAGGPREIELALEKTSSELLQVAGICEDIEFYPDLERGTAVMRQAQLLDAALLRAGKPAFFVHLDESQQLLAGNAFLRQLEKAFSPVPKMEARRQVISLLEAQTDVFSELGIELGQFGNSASTALQPLLR